MLVFVSANGTVFASRASKRGWRKTGDVVAPLANQATELIPVDASTFFLRHKNGRLSTGHFFWRRDAVRYEESPPLPPEGQQVRAVSTSGRMAFVSTGLHGMLCCRHGNGWETFPAQRADQAAFDADETHLCTMKLERVGANANRSLVRTYRIEGNRLRERGGDFYTFEIFKVYSAQTRWFFQFGDARYGVLPVSGKTARRNDADDYGRREALPPAVGNDIALTQGDAYPGNSPAIFRGNTVGIIRKECFETRSVPALHWAGFGAVYQIPKKNGAFLNNAPLVLPPGNESGNFFVVPT